MRERGGLKFLGVAVPEADSNTPLRLSTTLHNLRFQGLGQSLSLCGLKSVRVLVCHGHTLSRLSRLMTVDRAGGCLGIIAPKMRHFPSTTP